MKKNLCIIFLLLIGFSIDGFSQLSDRVNSPSTFKVGTRPVAGNFALYFGISYKDVEDLFSEDYSGLPLVNVKYYVTDNIVGRMGFYLSKMNTVEAGIIDPLVDGSLLTEKNFVEFSSEFILTPGSEYHFTSSNILDVYVGATIPFGRVKERFQDDQVYMTGEYSVYSREKSSMAYGLETFAGLQAFIADLPVAIGFEIGFTGFGYSNDKYKHERQMLISGIALDQLYYSASIEEPYTKYRQLESKNFEMKGNARITISYFFK